MTLEHWKICCEKAIRSNLKIRNARVFSNEIRHQQLVGRRRAKLRVWIAALRQARHPESAPLVAEAVRWKVA
jgi:hypothetical protein